MRRRWGLMQPQLALVLEGDSDLLVLLPLAPTSGDDPRCVPPQLVYAVLEINPRMLCMLGKHPTCRIAPPDQKNCPGPLLYFLLSRIPGWGGAHCSGVAAQGPFAGGSSLFAFGLRKVSLCSGSKSLLVPVLQVSSLAHSSSWRFPYEVTW